MVNGMTRKRASLIGVLAAGAAAATLFLVLAPSPAERLAAAAAARRWEDVEALALAQLPEASPAAQAELYRALGHAYSGQGEHAEAFEAFRAAYALHPEEEELRRRMAIALVGTGEEREEKGEVEAAVARYREAAELAPEVRQGHRALVAALRAQRRIDETVAALYTAMEHIPQDVSLRLQLAWLLASHPDPAKRDAERAMDLANGALMHDRTPETLDTFAVALAAHGDYEAAVRFEVDAIQLAGGPGAPHFDERRRRLMAFDKGESYVESLSGSGSGE